MVDVVEQIFCNIKFNENFLTKNKQEFEDWFVQLGKLSYGHVFEAIKAHCNLGDSKTDACIPSEGIVFQVYAPETFNLNRCKYKLKSDFEGALKYWGTKLKKWIFVHNQRGGLPMPIIELREKLIEQNPTVNIEFWGEQEIKNLFHKLDPDDKKRMFDNVPSSGDLKSINISDVADFVKKLAKVDFDRGHITLNPPSTLKQEKNNLSEEAIDYLKLGRRKTKLISEYLKSTTALELSEHIANSYREKYKELKELKFSAEEIFEHLQRFTGFFDGGPRQQATAMAVFVYYFDRCDIFENPKG